MSTKNQPIIGRYRKSSVATDLDRNKFRDASDMLTRFVDINASPVIEFDVNGDLAGSDNIRGRVFAETENLVAFVSMGPLTAGHTLLCPRFPSNCIGDVVSDAHMQLEFSSFLSEVMQMLTNVFGGEVLFFEHGGSSGLRPIGCSVLHAHLHLIPGVGCEVLDRMFKGSTAFVRNGEFAWEPVKDVLSTRFPAAKWQDYLFLSSSQSSWLARVGADRTVPHQYLRQAVGGAVGNERWDWRTWPNIPLVQESLMRIRDGLHRAKVELTSNVGPIFASPFTRVD